MTIELLFHLYRRLADGQSPLEISRQTGLHRSTVHAYATRFAELNLPTASDTQVIRAALLELIPKNAKPQPVANGLAVFSEEIRRMVSGKEPMKPKTAWEVICTKYDLSGKVSYSTFKRFYRTLDVPTRPPTIRMEVDPGHEVQIDYAKMGTHIERFTGKRVAVHAFIGCLSHGRLPFVQFVYKQTKPSFIASITSMFDFYEGVPKRLSLDNLKAGVIKPDIYDPELNRSLAECAEHYGFFVDPCRVASPREKGKVERLVQTVRELYRRLSTLYPNTDLSELNRLALIWCRDEYGMRPHGTTAVAPMKVFLEYEQKALRPLPETTFELSEWGSAVVHPDQYFRFKNKLYSLPSRYIGQTVQIRLRAKMVDIFHREELVRSYTIPKGYRSYLEGDFPQSVAGRADGSYPAFLIRRAEREFGALAAKLLTRVLEVPANLNARKAMGILDQMRKHKGSSYFGEVLGKACIIGVEQPRTLAAMFEYARKSTATLTLLPRSEAGKAMIRDVSYYTN